MNSEPAFEQFYAVPSRNGVAPLKASRGSGVPMVNMGDLFACPWIRGHEMERAPLSEIELERSALEPGDLLFARRSLKWSGAGVCSIFLGSSEPTTFESSLIRVRLDRSRAHPLFFFYFFRSQPGRRRMETIIEQTAVAGIKASDLARLGVRVPPIDQQERIATILGTLDDKIENNRRVARTLEQITATLFKARFVDFVDHDDLLESELGPIPRGWRVSGIYEIADVTYGQPFKSALFSGTEGIPLIRIRDLATDEPSVLTPEERTDARLIRAGDIVVGMDGEFRAHAWAGPDAWLNQRVCAFDPKGGVSRAFILEAVKGPLSFFEATKSGTTVIHLGKRDIDTFRIVRPPNDVMRRFVAEADPLLSMSVALQLEARTLVRVRDSLLPHLISGRLRVQPPEGELAEAA